MKIVLAPDKFKGSLSGNQIIEAFAMVSQEIKELSLVAIPLADGGDGVLDVMSHYGSYTPQRVVVHDPLHRLTDATYMLSEDGSEAIIEMAEASGLRLLKTSEYDPLHTSSFGTGELIRHAVNNGARSIILGIGGSATCDAGMGMAAALGYSFRGEDGKKLEPTGVHMREVTHIHRDDIIANLEDCQVRVACDVDNPLFGEHGAAYIYAPQKGASAEQVQDLDLGLRQISKVWEQELGRSVSSIPGSGAAGGLGGGAMVYLEAEMISGSELFLEVSHFIEKSTEADWIVFCEGKVDEQSFMGKLLGHILERKSESTRLALLCGDCTLSDQELGDRGVDLCLTITSVSKDMQDAMDNAFEHTCTLARQLLLYIMPGK